MHKNRQQAGMSAKITPFIGKSLIRSASDAAGDKQEGLNAIIHCRVFYRGGGGGGKVE